MLAARTRRAVTRRRKDSTTQLLRRLVITAARRSRDRQARLRPNSVMTRPCVCVGGGGSLVGRSAAWWYIWFCAVWRTFFTQHERGACHPRGASSGKRSAGSGIVAKRYAERRKPRSPPPSRLAVAERTHFGRCRAQSASDGRGQCYVHHRVDQRQLCKNNGQRRNERLLYALVLHHRKGELMPKGADDTSQTCADCDTDEVRTLPHCCIAACVTGPFFTAVCVWIRLERSVRSVSSPSARVLLSLFFWCTLA